MASVGFELIFFHKNFLENKRISYNLIILFMYTIETELASAWNISTIY